MEFVRIVSADDPLFERAFALYEKSFPEHEQRYREGQAALMPNPLYHFDVLWDDGAFAGILLYWEGSGYTYIEHFAIDTALRGKSLGSKSLEAFCGRRSFVVLEIDPPVDEQSFRREKFYTNLGFERNTFAHAHPAYRKKFMPHDLVVMSYPKPMEKDKYELFNRELREIVMKDSPV